jgi:hypothetical protein
MHAGEFCGATVDTTLQYSTVSIGISHGMGYKGVGVHRGPGSGWDSRRDQNRIDSYGHIIFSAHSVHVHARH